MSTRKIVGVIGASSMVGQCLLPLLIDAGYKITAFSRNAKLQSSGPINWELAPSNIQLSPIDNQTFLFDSTASSKSAIPFWICLAPIWVLPEYFQLLKNSGAKRIVALSSTSRFTKDHSSDDSEQCLARQLISAEAKLQKWSEESQVEWVILRPTLIYGLGKDKNIKEISRLIQRFGFFPIIGKANGLRQPIYVKDLALIILSALSSQAATNKSYNVSGGETLSYKTMIERIFLSLNRKPLFLTIPKEFMQFIILILRCLPRYRNWKLAMAERMNQDLVFDHHEAINDLGFSPRPFRLEAEDLN